MPVSTRTSGDFVIAVVKRIIDEPSTIGIDVNSVYKEPSAFKSPTQQRLLYLCVYVQSKYK